MSVYMHVHLNVKSLQSVPFFLEFDRVQHYVICETNGRESKSANEHVSSLGKSV